MRLYGDLASWFHLLTAPGDYEVEATRWDAILAEVPEAVTLLELGSGGGNNESHLRASFTCTLSDVSPQMLSLSGTLNPGWSTFSATCGRYGSAARSTSSSCTTP